MWPGRTAMLLILAAGQACAQTAPKVETRTAPLPTQTESARPVKRIFVPPPVQWDNAMVSFGPALQQTSSDFGILTAGITFGMTAAQVNARLADPYPGLSWNGLPMANEYPGEVRYLGLPMASAGALRMGLTACVGRSSYVVFLFSRNGLFRLSYRLFTDKACADTSQAAQEIFARIVPIGQIVALSVRYQSGTTQIVDITDPTAGYLIPTRWRQGSN